MIKNNSLIVKGSLDKLRDKWDVAIIFTIIYMIVASITATTLIMSISNLLNFNGINNLDIIQLVQVVSTLLILIFICSVIIIPLYIGYCRCFIALIRDENIRWNSHKTIFRNYRVHLAKGVHTIILINVYTVLWSLLLVFPGIMKAYSYAMTPFILADNDFVTPVKAIKKSQELMKGHKMKLFYLDIRFLGWTILSIMTLGIGFIWLLPYYTSAKVNFYEDVKSSY